MKRFAFAALAVCAALAGCADDGTVTPIGGDAFEANFTPVTSVRFPTMVARAFGRTVNSAAVVDSVVGEIALLKTLDGRARYQFYLVNGLDSTATPISHRQWTIRTDTLLDSLGGLRTPVDTSPLAPQRPVIIRDFWPGAFYGRVLRFAVPLLESDSIHQRAGWLVLTIQSDSTRTAYTDSTPKPLFVRIRDQKGTPTRIDDAVPTDTLRGNFGEFLSPTRQTRYAAGGTGSLLFWDVAKTGIPAFRVQFENIRKPPRGYFYQPIIIDSLTGTAYAWGDVYDADGKSLVDADSLRDSIIPTLRATQAVNATVGQAENYTRVELLLEPKSARPALRAGLPIYSAMTLHRASIPAALAAKRAALGSVQVIVTRGTQGGAPAPRIGVVVQGPGNNFNTLLGNRNTDSTGTARFTGVAAGEVRVLAIPFGGSVVDTRATVVSGQATTVRMVVP